MTAEAIRLTNFVTTFDSGGTERQFLNLSLGLADRGFAIRFGCLRETGRLRAELETKRVPVTEYRMRSFYSGRFVARQWQLARDLRTNGTEILQSYNLYGNVFAIPAARMAGVPLVVAGIRDCGVYLTRWTRLVQRHVCRLADVVIVNAQGIKDWLVDDGYAHENIVVIRNGVDLSRFLEPVANAPATVRHEFRIPSDAPLISIVARLCPSKGIGDLVEAMAAVHARHPDAYLLVVGEQLKATNGTLAPTTEYREALAARARELGVAHRIVFAGFRNDIPAIQQGVDLAVHPSHTEGLSNAVLESMASGAPVVATPVGGTPELIHHDRTGWLVPPRDPRALAASICTLLDDPARRRRLGQAGREFARDSFSIPRMVRATEDLYRDALRYKRSGRGPASTRPWTVQPR